MTRKQRLLSVAPVSVAVLCGVLAFAGPIERANAQPGPNVNPQFLGRWCVQGDPSRIATIAGANPGIGLQLTNENGSTSPAQTVGLSGSTIVALNWNLVQGTLSSDGSHINWSNGTYWNHCAGRRTTLDGTWYANGDPTRACSISQQYGALNFVNETGSTASGNFDGPNHLVAQWQGKPVGGTISPDGTRITWSNGTFWSR